MRAEGKGSPSSSDLSTLNFQLPPAVSASLRLSTSRALPAALARETSRLARENNCFIGTSSWKYEGWLGQIYDEQRYLTRGKLSTKRFETECLEEYAEIFPSVCVDAGYYRFPSEKYLANLCAQVPDGFRLSFKVTDEITVKKFSRLDRFGDRAGTDNTHFLDARLFVDACLGPLSPHRRKTGWCGRARRPTSSSTVIPGPGPNSTRTASSSTRHCPNCAAAAGSGSGRTGYCGCRCATVGWASPFPTGAT
jgi:hypothetical protein